MAKLTLHKSSLPATRQTQMAKSMRRVANGELTSTNGRAANGESTSCKWPSRKWPSRRTQMEELQMAKSCKWRRDESQMAEPQMASRRAQMAELAVTTTGMRPTKGQLSRKVKRISQCRYRQTNLASAVGPVAESRYERSNSSVVSPFCRSCRRGAWLLPRLGRAKTDRCEQAGFRLQI